MLLKTIAALNPISVAWSSAPLIIPRADFTPCFFLVVNRRLHSLTRRTSREYPPVAPDVNPRPEGETVGN